MEDVPNKTGSNLGVAALITAIITFVLAVIPCVGLIAIIPGIIAIVLASVGLSQSARNNSPRGVIIAGLIIGIIATMISVSQVFVAAKIAKNADKWPGDIRNIINDVQDNVVKEIEDANISIKVESNGDKVEINTSTDKKDREQKLEDLEGGTTQKDDTLQRKNSTGSYRGLRLRSEPYLIMNIIFAGVIILIIAYSGIFSPDQNNYPVVCIHERITGEPCFSCGLSHSFSLIVRGRIDEAYEWNIYGMRVFIFFISQLIMRIVFSLYYLKYTDTRKATDYY